MNKIHQRRLTWLIIAAIGVSIGVGLLLYALKQNINAFLTPSQIQSAHLKTDDHFRLGGLVKNHSLRREEDGMTIHFVVTDLHTELPVTYRGIPPDLFREGKGVIAEGHLNQEGEFVANQILAKHDENYRPKGVA